MIQSCILKAVALWALLQDVQDKKGRWIKYDSQTSEQCTRALLTEMGKGRAGERREAEMKCFGKRVTENSISNFIKFPSSSRLEHIQAEMLNKQLDMSLKLKQQV